MTRERDYAFEALAEVTSTDPSTGRGELNKALKDIRVSSGIEDSYLLADEIHLRAKLYRQAMPEMSLTPSALAKHWLRVFSETEKRQKTAGMNLHAEPSHCSTCGGDRFVEVGSYPSWKALRMKQEGKETAGLEMYEDLAPCPDCNHQDISYYRHDGSKFRPPDPAKVREMMGR